MLCIMENISKLAICSLFKPFTSHNVSFANRKRNQVQVFKGQTLSSLGETWQKFDTQVKLWRQGTLAFRNLIKITVFPNNFTWVCPDHQFINGYIFRFVGLLWTSSLKKPYYGLVAFLEIIFNVVTVINSIEIFISLSVSTSPAAVQPLWFWLWKCHA